MKRLRILLVFYWLILQTACGQTTGQINPPVQDLSVLATETSLPSVASTLPPALTDTPTQAPKPTSTVTPTPEASPGVLYVSQVLTDSVAVIPAPEIKGLVMQPGSQAGTVDYLDAKGKIALTAGARHLDSGLEEDNKLSDLLFTLYGNESPYFRGETYPVFFFPVEGIYSGFFGVDKTLSKQQISLMKEALQMLTREEFTPFRYGFFGLNISYVIYDRLDYDAVGINYVGINIVLLSRRRLFGNKYLLAEALVHEGTNIIQQNQVVNCQELLRMEIGNRKIPLDFDSWDAEAVMQGVHRKELGSYHVSYWILLKLGFSQPDDYRRAIYTGKLNGESVVAECERIFNELQE